MTTLSFTLSLPDPAADGELREAAIVVDAASGESFTILDNTWLDDGTIVPQSIIESSIDRIGDGVAEAWYERAT